MVEGMKLLVEGLKLPFSVDVSLKRSFYQLKSIKILNFTSVHTRVNKIEAMYERSAYT